jgi:hypothetical protein
MRELTKKESIERRRRVFEKYEEKVPAFDTSYDEKLLYHAERFAEYANLYSEAIALSRKEMLSAEGLTNNDMFFAVQVAVVALEGLIESDLSSSARRKGERDLVCSVARVMESVVSAPENVMVPSNSLHLITLASVYLLKSLTPMQKIMPHSTILAKVADSFALPAPDKFLVSSDSAMNLASILQSRAV